MKCKREDVEEGERGGKRDKIGGQRGRERGKGEREREGGMGRKKRERGLTTKVALFAGFKTRNFLSRFSQSVDM